VPTRGNFSKYELPAENLKAKITLTWPSEFMVGIACDKTSPGFTSLCNAISEVRGEANPYSICGSLPLVDQLQLNGFDVQLTGFGLSNAYHAVNEYCLFSDMAKGFTILAKIIQSINN
jgi:acetylornithine deacetylase